MSSTEPVIYVYGKRVTERDVRRCMDDSGDLGAYEACRISKAEAFRQTANYLRNLAEMPSHQPSKVRS